MTEPNETPAESEKRPFQFSLRTMFVVTFIWAFLCAMTATFGISGFFFGAIVFVLVTCFPLACILFCFPGYRRMAAGLLVLPTTLFFSLVCLGPGERTGGTVSPDVSCKINLKTIGLAMHSYADDHGTFPPAYIADASGKPMHSWRVLLLPYMGDQELYDAYDFDEPWDGPNNSKLHGRMPEVYACPCDETAARHCQTSYVLLTGPDTMFPGGESVTLDDVPDGLSKTLVLVEVVGSGIHWMEPRDLNVSEDVSQIELSTAPRISSKHDDTVHVAFADGSVHSFSKGQLTREKLRELSSRDGGEDVDLEDLR